MSTPWESNTHGFITGPISIPEASIHGTNNSTDSKTNMVPSSSPPTVPGPPSGNSKGLENENIGQGQSQAQGADPKLSVQHQHQQQMHQQPPMGPLQHPASVASAPSSSMSSFASAILPHSSHHPTQHHSMGLMGGNNHMPPQYGLSNHHHPHMQTHHVRQGDMRGQGHIHPHGQNIPNNSYHQPGLVRPAGRYPVQHAGRGGDNYGQNMHMQGHFQHGRPGPVSNYHHHQQHPQYHAFPPQGPHSAPGPSAAGMEQVGSRGPSPSHLQQHQPHTQKPQTNAPTAGAAVAMPQSQPLRRVSTNENMSNAPATNNRAPHEDPNQTRNFHGHIGPQESKQQTAMPPHQQQNLGPGQGPSIPHGRQDHEMGGQEHHRNLTGSSTMHQRYPGHQNQHQFPQHDSHYGGTSSIHHGGHPNGMHTDMHHYNYRYPSQGGSGPPPMQYHGHPDNGIPAGYPHRIGGHREVYPHGHPQNHYQQHHPNGYGQPLLHPPPQQRPTGHGFQLPKYNASRTSGDLAGAAIKKESSQPMSRSPSPPPSPPPAPSAQALLRQKLREQDAKKSKEQPTSSTSAGEADSSMNKKNSDSMSISDDSMRRDSSGSNASNNGSKPMALGDRGNVAATAPSAVAKKPVTETMKKTVKQEDITADAASILLQLGSVMNRSTGGSENQKPSNQSTPPIPTSVQHSSSMDDVSDAGTMLTMQTEAPDLTSEPSTDSIDSESNVGASLNKPMTASISSSTPKQVAETDFPCAVPDRYPTRLALPYDNAKLNTLHCFLRSELLEIFVVSKSQKKSPCHSPSSSVGRVGLRCVHCAMMRSCRREDPGDAPMAVFYPKSIAEIYRLVTSWQRCHLRKCKNVPPAARARWQTLRETDRSRGKTHYWVTSAKQIGLMDCQSRAGGIRFVPDFDHRTLPADTKLTPSTKEAAARAAEIAAKAQKIVSIANAAAASNMTAVPENAEMTDVSPNSTDVAVL